MKSAPVITFDYRVSRLLIAAIVIAASLAMLALALCGMTLGAKLFFAALVVAYTAFAMRKCPVHKKSPARFMHAGLITHPCPVAPWRVPG
jgi:predicted transporter